MLPAACAVSGQWQCEPVWQSSFEQLGCKADNQRREYQGEGINSLIPSIILLCNMDAEMPQVFHTVPDLSVSFLYL